MTLEFSTPALLFPAVSLLMLAYTNRFVTLASLIRKLRSDYKESGERMVYEQIVHLRRRVQLIRFMQLTGVLSIFACTVSMVLIYLGLNTPALGVFGLSLLLMMTSLILSAWEIHISSGTLDILLKDLEGKGEEEGGYKS